MRRSHLVGQALTLLAAAFVLVGSVTLAAALTSSDRNGLHQRKCVRGDYVATYGPCLANSTRLRSWKKSASASCVVGDAAGQPASTFVPCAACPPGTQHQGGKRDTISDCVSCSVGKYLDVSELPSTCTACPFGTTARPVLSFRDGFDGFSGNASALSRSLVTYMASPLSNPSAWQVLNGTGMDLVGYSRNGSTDLLVGMRSFQLSNDTFAVSSSFKYGFDALSDGLVELTFSLHHIDQAGDERDEGPGRLEDLMRHRFVLFVDGTEYDVRDAARSLADSRDAAFVVVVPYMHTTTRREHYIGWQTTDYSQSTSTHYVLVRSLVVSGDLSGGVDACEPCPAGYACAPQTTQASPCPPGTFQPATHAQRCLPCTGNTIAPGYAFRACLACDYNRSANADHTMCEETCIYAYDDVLYDFTALSGVALMTAVDETAVSRAAKLTIEEADEADIDRVYLSLCHAMPIRDVATEEMSPNGLGRTAAGNGTFDTLCVGDVHGHNSSTSAYACQRVNSTTGRHFGNVVDFASAADGRVNMVTSMGSLLVPLDMLGNASDYAERTWRAVIQLECSHDDDDGGSNSDDHSHHQHGSRDAHSLRVVGLTTDTMTLAWRSKLACPLCTPQSYTKVESRCNASSFYTVTYERRGTVFCLEGYTPPVPHVAPCTPCPAEAYTLEWQACDVATQTQTGLFAVKPAYQGCRDSEAWSPSNQTRSCLANSRTTSTAKKVSLVIGVLMILLACGLGFMLVNPSDSPQGLWSAVAEDDRELDTYIHNDHHDDNPASLSTHYSVADSVENGTAPSDTAASRFSDLMDRLAHSMSAAFQGVWAAGSTVTASSTGRGSPPLSGMQQGNGYRTLATTDENDLLFSDDETAQRPSHTSSQRHQLLFTLEDEDDDDLLPPHFSS